MNAEQLAKMCHQPQDGLAPLAPADHFFTLYTGQASDNIPINYETSTGINIWNEVTKDYSGSLLPDTPHQLVDLFIWII